MTTPLLPQPRVLLSERPWLLSVHLPPTRSIALAPRRRRTAVNELGVRVVAALSSQEGSEHVKFQGKPQPRGEGTAAKPEEEDYKDKVLRSTTLRTLILALPEDQAEVEKWNTSILAAAFHRLARFGGTSREFQSWIKESNLTNGSFHVPDSGQVKPHLVGTSKSSSVRRGLGYERVSLLVAEVERRVLQNRCSGQGLSNLCWAHGKIALGGTTFMAALTSALLALLDSQANAYPKRALREIELVVRARCKSAFMDNHRRGQANRAFAPMQEIRPIQISGK